MKIEEYINKKINRLVIFEIFYIGKVRYTKSRCDCGTVKQIRLDHIISNKTQSCGCFRSEVNSTHGDSGYNENRTPEYRAWTSIKQRCLNPNCSRYRNYGGRGITICEEWIDNYPAFLAHVGRKPAPEYSIDRINNDGNYEPGNVKWSTQEEQQNNKHRNYDSYKITEPELLEDIIFPC